MLGQGGTSCTFGSAHSPRCSSQSCRNCSPTPLMEKPIFINVIRAGGILDAVQ